MKFTQPQLELESIQFWFCCITQWAEQDNCMVGPNPLWSNSKWPNHKTNWGNWEGCWKHRAALQCCVGRCPECWWNKLNYVWPKSWQNLIYCQPVCMISLVTRETFLRLKNSQPRRYFNTVTFPFFHVYAHR